MGESMLDELIQVQDEDVFEQILQSLISTDDVTGKTEILKPLNLTRLNVMARWMRMEGVPEGANLIEIFIKYYLDYMVSYKRQSRKEVIQALTSKYIEQKTLTDKLIPESEGR